jgi:hypothetical protein
MSNYIKSLLNNPTTAKPDDYLVSFGIKGSKALKMLMDENKPYGPIITRSEQIKTGDDGKDRFYIKYTLLNKENNFYKKMKNLYTKYTKNGKLNESTLKEEGEGGFSGGATAGSESTGAYEAPLTKKPIKRKTIYITEKQLQYVKEAVQMDTMAGDFGYDAPGLEISENDPSMDHSNMIKKSFNEELKRRVIKKLVKEGYNDDIYYASGVYYWYPAEDLIDANIIDMNDFDDLVESGVLPEELGGNFEIVINVEYTHDAGNYDTPPSSNEIKREIDTESYNEAMKYINMVKNGYIKNFLIKALKNCVNADIDFKNTGSSREDYLNDKYDFERDNRI